MEEREFVPRARTLTDADMAALADMMHKMHSCRFDNVTREDMDFIRDLLGIYKETRSEIIKWAVRGVVWCVLAMVALGAYIKYSGRH